MVSRLAKILQRHLQLDGYNEEGLAESFITLSFGSPLALYDGKSDIEVLDRLSRALADFHPNALDKMSWGAREHLSYRLIFGFGKSTEEKMACLSEVGKARLRLFDDFMESSENIRQVIDELRREIEASDRTRRSFKLIDQDRLQVVEVARDFWRRYSGRKLPTAEIKDAQPFARFLADLFEELEIDCSPVTAFRAWRRQLGNSPEEL